MIIQKMIIVPHLRLMEVVYHVNINSQPIPLIDKYIWPGKIPQTYYDFQSMQAKFKAYFHYNSPLGNHTH